MPTAKPATGYDKWFKKWQRDGAPCWPGHAVLVIVRWTDATYHDEDTGTVEAFLVGFLKEANDKHIALAMEVYSDRDSRTHVTVPIGMVNTVATLGHMEIPRQ
jgi:hypothetical protein